MSRAKPRREAAKRRAQTDEALVALAHLLPDLDDDLPALRQRGPHGRGVLTDDEIEQQFYDWQHRKALAVYLEQQGLTPSGPRSIPVDFTARELRAAISAQIIALENHVASQMVDRASPSHALTVVRSLADVGQADDVARINNLRAMLAKLRVPAIEEEVAARSTEILSAARAAIDPPNLGQLGACPWCGRKTLEVDYEHETITCTNKGCRCARADCKCPNEPHVWRRPEWEPLAQLCRTVEAAARQAILDSMMSELRQWIREQMAGDETRIRGAMYTARELAGLAPLNLIELLSELERDRDQLDNMGDFELRTFGLRYAERDGYLEEWRP